LSVPFMGAVDFTQATIDCITQNVATWTVFYHDGTSWIAPGAQPPSNVEVIVIHIPGGVACSIEGTLDLSKLPLSYSRLKSGEYNYVPLFPSALGKNELGTSITGCSVDGVFGWDPVGSSTGGGAWEDLFNTVLDPSNNQRVYSALSQGLAVHCS